MKYLSGRHKYPYEHGYDHLRTVFNTPLNVYKYPSGRSYNHLRTVFNTPLNVYNYPSGRSYNHLGTVFHHVLKGISRECLRRTHVCLGVDRRVYRIHRRRKTPMIQSLGLFFFAGRPKAIHFRACLGGPENFPK